MARLPTAGIWPELVAGMHCDARMLLFRRVALRLAALSMVAVVAACSGSDESADVSSGPSPVASPGNPPAPSPAGCSATVTGLPPSISADAAEFPFSIAIASSCDWRAVSDAAWASVSPGSGRGNATLNLKVEQNTRPDDTRTATVTVNGAPYRVLQNRFACSYTLDRTSFDLTASGGNLRIVLTTREVCPWTVTASESWLRVLTPSGTGSATISVDAESQSSSAQRRAFLTIAGVRVDVLQRGN